MGRGDVDRCNEELVKWGFTTKLSGRYSNDRDSVTNPNGIKLFISLDSSSTGFRVRSRLSVTSTRLRPSFAIANC